MKINMQISKEENKGILQISRNKTTTEMCKKRKIGGKKIYFVWNRCPKKSPAITYTFTILGKHYLLYTFVHTHTNI